MIHPVPKPAPVPAAVRPSCVLGTLRDDVLAVYVHERVLEDILNYSEKDVSRELGGFLIGGFHLDGGPYVEVRHFLAAGDIRSHATSLTFTHETWAGVNREVDRQFPGALIVGWQHTHPRLGVFLSGYDLFLHRHFFREPWQVALVVDPVRREFGFFQWCGTDIVGSGFVCVRKSGEAPCDRIGL